MEFILPFTITESPSKISYGEKIAFIGSCFSEEIGEKMKKLKFDILQNPHGIIYDPLSIVYTLDSCIENKKYTEEDVFQINEIWQCWHHHSSFSGTNRQSVINAMNASQIQAHHFLKEASWIIITPGTAFNYNLKETGMPVSNCHKAPSVFFVKKLIPTQEIISLLTAAISKLRTFNPKLKIIFTVSPVRHVRDGIIENNHSKARLIDAIHSLTENLQDAFYFPAYELIIDVLRDYRFFKNDLVHPTEAAVNYVFEEFCNAFIDEKGRKILEEIKKIQNALNHKPFQRESNAYKKFASAQIENIKKISDQFPFLDFSNEQEFFSKYL
jgi:hypothetical protein